jgi:hypothetical protein
MGTLGFRIKKFTFITEFGSFNWYRHEKSREPVQTWFADISLKISTFLVNKLSIPMLSMKFKYFGIYKRVWTFEIPEFFKFSHERSAVAQLLTRLSFGFSLGVGVLKNIFIPHPKREAKRESHSSHLASR